MKTTTAITLPKNRLCCLLTHDTAAIRQAYGLADDVEIAASYGFLLSRNSDKSWNIHIEPGLVYQPRYFCGSSEVWWICRDFRDLANRGMNLRDVYKRLTEGEELGDIYARG